MGGGLSTGAIVGIVFSSFGLLALIAGCAFLKTVLNHRRRVRRAVNAAASSSPAAPAPPRSRYPEAIPCDNYDELFPDEEPARGNVVFQSRAELDRMRDVLVRIEDAGDDRSSEDFSTTEMVSVNNSFARGGRPPVHAGQMVQERLKPTPAMVPSKMGSFDNEHNVAMSFVSAYPTPASSMPAFGARSRGPLPSSSSFNPGVGGSFAGSYGAPPVARADHATSHFQDSNRGGMRLLVPTLDRTHFSDPQTRETAEEEDNSPTPKAMARTPLTEEREGREGSASMTAHSFNLPRPPIHREPHVMDTASFQERFNANAASFNQHLSPSVGLRPPVLSMHTAAGRSGLLGSTRVDPTLLPRPHAVPDKKHKLRIHRQHRVRKVNKGGYVVLEETESSSSDAEEERVERNGEMVSAPEQQQQQGEEEGRGEEVRLGPVSSPSSPSPAPGTDTSVNGTSSSPAPAPAATGAAAKKQEKKRRYYFEKLSSLDVYGRGQYMSGATSGYPPMEPVSSGNESEEGETVVPRRPVLPTTTHPMSASMLTSNSTRKPT